MKRLKKVLAYIVGVLFVIEELCCSHTVVLASEIDIGVDSEDGIEDCIQDKDEQEPSYTSDNWNELSDQVIHTEFNGYDAICINDEYYISGMLIDGNYEKD